MKKIKKLLFVINIDWFFISHRLPIALAAIKNGYEVHVSTGISTKKAELESYGLVVHPLPINRGRANFTDEISTFKAIVHTIQTVKPSILHLVTIKPVLYGGVAAHFCNINGIIVAISGLGYIFTAKGHSANIRRWFIGNIYRLALNHDHLKVIFQNDNDQQLLSTIARLSKAQTIMIPGSGVDLEKFDYHDKPLNTLTVIMAARLLIDKGVHEFVKSAELIHERHPDVNFQLAGTIDPDNPASITKEQVKEWQKNTSIQILGQRDDISFLFSQAEIVVLPSYREGFPKVLIEAAACGCAVVTTDVPGCRDAIIPNVTGLLVPPHNTQALTNAIEQLLNNPKLCLCMGKASRKLAEECYSIEKVVQTHLDIYEELLSPNT